MGMCVLANEPTIIYEHDADGYAIAQVDLKVSTVADLPELEGVVEGTKFKCGKGSTAQIVQSNDPLFVTLDGDDGTWYPEQS